MLDPLRGAKDTAKRRGNNNSFFKEGYMPDNMDIEKYLDTINKSRAKDPTQHDISSNDSLSSSNVMIDPTCDVRGIQRMRFGKNVVIQKDCWLNIAYDNPDSKYIIEIGEGTNIGRRCTISGANSIVLGKNVLLGPNVFIADTNHEYKCVEIPIIHQGVTTHSDRIRIGDDTWIGINSVVVGNVSIGKHCVIGANSVVNKDIPDYCVAGGNPCRILKIFDIELGQWVKIKEDSGLEQYLSKRNNSDLLDHIENEKVFD